jgi:hypothetical protein
MQVLLRPSKFDISRMYEAIEKLKIVACDVGELNLAIEVDILEQILRLVEKVTTKYQMQSKIIYIFNYCPPWNNMKFKSVLEKFGNFRSILEFVNITFSSHIATQMKSEVEDNNMHVLNFALLLRNFQQCRLIRIPSGETAVDKYFDEHIISEFLRGLSSYQNSFIIIKQSNKKTIRIPVLVQRLLFLASIPNDNPLLMWKSSQMHNNEYSKSVEFEVVRRISLTSVSEHFFYGMVCSAYLKICLEIL